MRLSVLIFPSLGITIIEASFIFPLQLRGHTTTNQSKAPNGGLLYVGYLDDLSPSGGDKDKQDNGNRIKRIPKSTGVVPSGRGPLASYLDNVATGGNGQPQEEPAESLELPEPPSEDSATAQGRGSGVYLTNLGGSYNDARTDIRNLLTQRSIQSFLRLCEECRDPHSAKWITDFLCTNPNLVDFHGTGSKFLDDYGGLWDAPLLSIIAQPKDQVIVSAKRRGRGHGGWSKDNPYLEERWMEMSIDIDPVNLGSRILAVREQIASEWVIDLDVLIQSNDLILDSFFNTLKHSRDEEGSADASLGESLAGGDGQVFERTAAYRMNDVSRFATTTSSLFRRSNFDLLCNLCTQAAVHRILREMKEEGKERTVPYVFLRDWYIGRAEEYFDGHLQFGQADDFMDDLLQTSPSILSTDDGMTELVDPVGVAEIIIKMRKGVAEDWKLLMKGVAEDHTGLRQALLSNQIKAEQNIILQNYEDKATFQ